MASTRILGYEELLAKLDTLSKLKDVGAAVKAGAAHFAYKMRVDVPRPSRLTRASVYGRSFFSDKQRRFFFYALKAGIIQVPYSRGSSPRSQKLLNSWTVKMLSPLTGEAGTDVPYAGLVQGEGTQTKYHAASGWKTEARILEQEADYVVGKIHEAIEKAINE